MAHPLTIQTTKVANAALDRLAGQGRIRAYSYKPAVEGVRYRRWTITLLDGSVRHYGPQEVVAFLDGVGAVIEEEGR